MMPGRQAGSGVSVRYNADCPKQGSKRFNSITMTIHFAHLGISFIYCVSHQVPQLESVIVGNTSSCKNTEAKKNIEVEDFKIIQNVIINLKNII